MSARKPGNEEGVVERERQRRETEHEWKETGACMNELQWGWDWGSGEELVGGK